MGAFHVAADAPSHSLSGMTAVEKPPRSDQVATLLPLTSAMAKSEGAENPTGSMAESHIVRSSSDRVGDAAETRIVEEYFWSHLECVPTCSWMLSTRRSLKGPAAARPVTHVELAST